ncbi:MAG TPA: DegT/DnrJ/EryC1/StrS family aminotransferase [Candidatus Micrarchaeaceae archaeon]|nr:DegT/DnrJ/EryC1/StrS family aminotransferase [Candidatus Micrarchaeaceae archaeon]
MAGCRLEAVSPLTFVILRAMAAGPDRPQIDRRPAPRIRLACPDVGTEELEAIKTALLSGILTNGPQTAAFEEVFARKHEVSHAVAFANGTVALAGIYTALGIGPGDEVIVPSMTFISTATSVVHVGARPVFAEILEGTFNLDPADVEARLTPRTRAIVPVHYGGQPANMAELASIAESAGVELIEDAAEAHGAIYRGRHVGGLGHAAMFSFTPTKNVTMGEGGIVTTDDDDLAARLRLLRNHGQTRLYEHESLGYNWRITEMQAAMGMVQMGKLDAILARKQANAQYLRTRLVDCPGVQLPSALEDRTHTYMLFTLTMPGEQRDRVMRSMLDSGIEARLYFPPAHLQTIFRSDNVRLPRTERLAGQMMSIPFHSRLTRTELDQVADQLRLATSLG